MKFSALVLVAFCCATTALADDGVFSTRVIKPTDGTFTLDVPKRRYVTILNFVQDRDACAVTGGVSTCTTGIVYVAQGGTAAVPVLYADRSANAESGKNLFVAGPATITVPANSPANLLLTYGTAGN